MQRTCQLSITLLVKSNTKLELFRCDLSSNIKSCTKNRAFQNKKAPFLRGLTVNDTTKHFKESELPYGIPPLFH